ncbi:quaternary ammonium compound-resistance protein SugE [Thermomonospora echinospora]|uniref:Quaternary ammonium compound-resistance protein SugE n=1 Tax=Thermomonospora echinospora TaxID=1992 RepID=A0A1H6EAQ8_9ACTN|nr:multidrug efflux SMR transporter [Thermomonospora echinospora]SEG94313.1 quaternary ammonium compound-resistance protein SugE [Thermomonospora echinospora]
MTWIILFCAALLECVWAVAFKQSDGFTRPWPAIVGVVTAVASVVLLAIALRALPVGTAYAVWTGLGAVGVAVVGIARFGESASPARLGFLTLILVGVAGLRFLESG